MGCFSSKLAHGNGDMPVNELSEVQSDPQWRAFNETLTGSTARAVIELAAATDESPHSFSLKSMKAVIDMLLEGNSAAAKVILNEKMDVLKDPDLKELVYDYLESSRKTIDVCTSFDKCLERAKQCRFLIKETVRQFHEASPEERVVRTEHNLRKLKVLGDPFANEFFEVFQSVYQQQISAQLKLRTKREALEKKLKSTKTWRKVSTVVFIATFASVLILSVVAAAVSAPPVFTALASALTVPIGSVGKWCSSLWSTYIKQVENELELVKTMRRMTSFRVSEMESIKNQVERLELTMETIGHVADAHLSEDESLRMAVDDISKKIDLVTDVVHDLVTRVKDCRQHVRDSTHAALDKLSRFQET